MPTHSQIDKLVAAAREASRRAYAPYSKFHVGAAVIAGGDIFTGCNVENASYGLTICAERNAIASAVAAGHKKIDALAIFTDTDAPTTPCGACRQVMAEFTPARDGKASETGGTEEFRIYVACASGPAVDYALDELLPRAFRKGSFDPEGT